ncbi:MAG: hypothetical protein QOF62_1458 [Pyrinomonadaceae bacterium]|jgi:hypothetical protein|nr:hypothetical protein [Pyrinomonadaceae bacterium]
MSLSICPDEDYRRSREQPLGPNRLYYSMQLWRATLRDKHYASPAASPPSVRKGSAFPYVAFIQEATPRSEA